MAAPSAIAGILFDKDGTLLDFDASWAPVNRRLALIAASGDAELAERLLAACGMDPATGHLAPDSLLAAGNSREIGEGLIASGASFAVDELVPLIDDLFASAAELSVPVTELQPLFARLHDRGLRLGIASSDNERSIRVTVRRFGIEEYVDFVAGYDSGHGSKPGPGMVLGFCAETGLEPRQVAVVGDNNHDLHMGRNAGAGLKVGVLSGTGSRQSLEEACDVLLNDITELESVLGAAPCAEMAHPT
ncbi:MULTISPECIES: HAD family hydrolase [Alphaproteobacteria]|uniref:phosphoglycolate phosphatase n=2 Tax=Alphaproteobacteria TaxID=28211 RepID=A0A512HI18_9HYPH|nr:MULTISPECIES: HAD family hydrolase [Alphaproteobacteria]GEO85095.1 phosphoglycolate phosphatase [Ciceribacter naphthalenivorans]GLR24571.1 phosphoglycolate phosphatase [Ciceribacter naphthalenivorans]GLT07427.1 phosphoglycolate phosphatase [Sphingomonas psychrolutea]